MTGKKIGEYKGFVFSDAIVSKIGKPIAYSTSSILISPVYESAKGQLFVKRIRQINFGNNPNPQVLGETFYDFLTGLRIDKLVPEDAYNVAPQKNDPKGIARPGFNKYRPYPDE